MRLSLGFTFLAQILAVVTSQVVVNVLPDHVTDGASIVQLTSQTSGFDAPKVLSLNSTTFDWWYFDVVSTDLDYSLVLVFFNSAPTGLWDGVPDLPSTLYGTVGITLPDGSALNSAVLGSQLTVITTDNGSSGSLNGTGWGWTSKPDMSQYEVIIDDPAAGIQGTVILNSRGPGHFPCAPVTAGPGQTLDLGNGFGWANAVPGSTAEVAFNFNGTKVAFTGSGYHDKNWGNKPTKEAVKSWLWGHGQLGPFDIVWFDAVTPDGVEHVSSYMTRNGQVVQSSCSGLSVRATGNNTAFPPVSGDGAPGGYHISMEVEGEGTLEVEVTHKSLISVQPGTSFRWTGSVTGGFGNGTNYTGPALYEQFTF